MNPEVLKQKSLIRIVDDDADVREALSFLLECEGWQVAAYDSAMKFLINDSPSIPGCLLLDIRMPELTGIELQQMMAERGIGVPIVFITGHADVDTAVDALRKGAVDFLQKPVNEDRLRNSILEACMLNINRDGRLWDRGRVLQAIQDMSPRERQVTDLLRAGLSNAEIAERLGLSPRSVQGHRNKVYQKLRVHNAADFSERLSVL